MGYATNRSSRHVVNMCFLVAANDRHFQLEQQRLAQAALQDNEGCPLQALVDEGMQSIARTIIAHSPSEEQRQMLQLLPEFGNGDLSIRCPRDEIAFESKQEGLCEKLDSATAGNLEPHACACVAEILEATRQSLAGTQQRKAGARSTGGARR